MAAWSTHAHSVPPPSSFSSSTVLGGTSAVMDGVTHVLPTRTRPHRPHAILDHMSTAPTLAADRAFNVFGDHSYRMDLRG